MVVRVSRGKVIVASTDFKIPFNDTLLAEPEYGQGCSVFMLAFEVGDFIMDRVRRIAGSFKNSDITEITMGKLAQDLTEARGGRENQKKVLRAGKDLLLDVLKKTDCKDEAPDVSALELYRLFVERELAIHIHMNMLKRSTQLAQGLLWVPTEAGFEQRIMQANIHGLSIEKLSDPVVDSLTLTRPTKFYSNEFFIQFQAVIDMYGIATYGEINPAVFAIVTFPFLFGVMFGDIFHGSLLLVAAIYLCWSSREPGTLAAQLGVMRHFFLLMGIFSLFNGFVYNDFTSMGTQTFGYSCWKIDMDKKDPLRPKSRLTTMEKDCVYPFGIDPMWFRSSDLEVAYLNSFKMKISVIFGVAHMILGTFIRCNNFVR